jgi:hypothetical protein
MNERNMNAGISRGVRQHRRMGCGFNGHGGNPMRRLVAKPPYTSLSHSCQSNLSPYRGERSR